MQGTPGPILQVTTLRIGSSTGIRAVIRDDKGVVRASLACRTIGLFLIEALACRISVQMAKSLQLNKVVVESDCLPMIQKLKKLHKRLLLS